MKVITYLKLVFFIAATFSSPCYCSAQSAATIADAKSYYQKGLASYNNGRYEDAIENCLISISDLPEPLTYYVLTNAYAKNGNPGASFTYANVALKIKPPLEPAYRTVLLRIREWAVRSLQQSAAPQLTNDANDDEKVSLVGEGLTGKTPPNFDLPAPSSEENPFSEQEENSEASNSGFRSTTIFSPHDPQHKVPVYDNNNNLVGEINFYGFTGGRNVGGGQSTALTFSIGGSSVPDAANLSSPMVTGWIVFQARELNVGAVKSKTVGMLTFKATILAVTKQGSDSYYMGSVKVVVNAYPFDTMHARRFYR